MATDYSYTSITVESNQLPSLHHILGRFAITMASSSHNSRAIKVSCFKYEDSEDEFGQVVVVYVILVENVAKNVKHILHKRYSDFLELFTTLRNLSPEIDNFRFPNKSLFNNRSQFTLERRLEGFNDFLQLALRMNPVPDDTVKFLELSALLKDSDEALLIKSRSRPNTTTIQSTVHNDNRRAPEIARSAVSEIEKADLPRDSSSLPQKHKQGDDLYPSLTVPVKRNEISNTTVSSNISCEDYAEKSVKKHLHLIGYFSLFAAVLIYTACVLCGVVDISTTTNGKNFVISPFLFFCCSSDAKNLILNKT